MKGGEADTVRFCMIFLVADEGSTPFMATFLFSNITFLLSCWALNEPMPPAFFQSALMRWLSDMENLDFIDEISQPGCERFLKGLPRQCKKCETWARYKKPKKHNGCFTVECENCHEKFEVVIGMKGCRR